MGKHQYHDEDDFRRDRDRGGRSRSRHSSSGFEEAPYIPPVDYRAPAAVVREAPVTARTPHRTENPASVPRSGSFVPNSYAPPRDGPRRPPEPQVTGEPETVTVKWFNTEKGFGFVVDRKGQDLFLHISVVKAAGLVAVEPNAEIVIQRGPGRKGGESANRIIV